MLGTYHLNALFEVLGKLHFIYEPAKLWDFVLEQSCRLLQTEAATFFEINEAKEDLHIAAAYGVDVNKLKTGHFRIGTGICGWVAQFQQPALVLDVKRDPRFNAAVDRSTGFETRSILSIPVFSQGHNYGVVELLNKKSGFNQADQEFMSLLARQAAVAYQNLRLMEESSKSRALLESLTENMSGGLVAVDAQGKVTLMNPAALRLLDWKGSAPLDLPLKVAFMDWPWVVQAVDQALAGKAVSRQESQVEGTPALRFGYTTVILKGSAKAGSGAAVLFQKLT